jgi:hypothetical protein
MKITILFKDPDGVHQCIRDEIADSLPTGLSAEEQDALIEIRRDAALGKLKRWIEYDENLEVEFDLDAGTAKVRELP